MNSNWSYSLETLNSDQMGIFCPMRSQKPWVNSNWSYSPETLTSGQNRQFFVPFDLEIWCTTLKNNMAPLLCGFKLCASFHSHPWIQTRVTARKPPIRVKIDVFLSRVTLKFDKWPWKTIRHLFYATSSFVHHQRLSWVLTSVTLTCDLWRWPFACTSLLSLVITLCMIW